MQNIEIEVSQKVVDVDSEQKVRVNIDYERLINKPSINGIELTGNKTSSELSIMGVYPGQYQEVQLEAVDDSEFLLVQNNSGTRKVKVGSFRNGMIKSADEIPEDLPIGSYLFVKKEDN